MAHILVNVLFSLFLLNIANVNYPGGIAVARLHRLESDSSGPVSVHICNLAAQTGVSRFTQLHSNWRYDKTEFLEDGSQELYNFTHLIVEAKSKYSPVLKMYSKSHDILDSVEGFSHVSINYNSFPPVRIKTKQFLYILKLKSGFVLPSPSKDFNYGKVFNDTEEQFLESDFISKDGDDDDDDDIDDEEEERQQVEEQLIEDISEEVIPSPIETTTVLDSSEHILDAENQSVEDTSEDITNLEKDREVVDHTVQEEVVKERDEEKKSGKIFAEQVQAVENITDDFKENEEDVNVEKTVLESNNLDKENDIIDTKSDIPPTKKVKSSIKKIIEAFKENEDILDVEKNESVGSKIKKTLNNTNKKKPMLIKPKTDSLLKLRKPVINTLDKHEIVLTNNETLDSKYTKPVGTSKHYEQSIEDADQEENQAVEEPQKQAVQDQELLKLQLEQLQKLLQLQQQQLDLLLQQQNPQKSPKAEKTKEKVDSPKVTDNSNASVKKEPILVDPAQLEEYEEKKKRTKLRIKNIIQNLRATSAIDPELEEQNLTVKPDSGKQGDQEDDYTEKYFKTEVDDEDYE